MPHIFRGPVYPPVASPDGRLVAFASGESIWVVRPGEDSARVPTREWHRFGFQARGGRLYFTVGDRRSDFWAAEIEAGG